MSTKDQIARKVALCLSLLVLTTIVYCAPPQKTASGDTIPSRYLPFSIILEGNFDLDEFPHLFDNAAKMTYPTQDGIPYYLRRTEDHYYSAYTIGPAILALPVYLVPVLAGMDPESKANETLARFTAVLTTACSAIFLFLALQLLVSTRWACAFLLVYAFGTVSLSISSQMMWQHGPSQLFLSLFLYLMVLGKQRYKYIPWACLAASCAIVMRSTNALAVLPFGVLILLKHRRHLILSALLFVVPVLLLAMYYLVHFGTLGAAYEFSSLSILSCFRQIPLHEGLYGILLSPAKGLFVYSPVLLLSIAGSAIGIRARNGIIIASTAGVLLVILLVSQWFMWWGGHCYGYRLLADMTPFLCFCLHPLGAKLEKSRPLAAIFLTLTVVSVCIQLVGAFRYDGRWDKIAQTDIIYESQLNPTDGPIFFYFKEIFGIPDKRKEPDMSQRNKLHRRPLEEVFKQPLEEIPDPPKTDLSIDKRRYSAQDTMMLRYEVTNPHRPRAMSCFFVLWFPDGNARFFDGRNFLRPRTDTALGWMSKSPVPYHTVSVMPVSLDGLRAGSYKWHAFSTDTLFSRIETRNSVDFIIEP
ncbi:MAG: glycosyltransferase family 39 protein [Deltaproteobacteria bacterium]|nr:glycosyltransferase family 39 protein [Deltaproteobacteria bacterium]